MRGEFVRDTPTHAQQYAQARDTLRHAYLSLHVQELGIISYSSIVEPKKGQYRENIVTANQEKEFKTKYLKANRNTNYWN